nr:unnamed protein product [Haemonchus contortus]
MLNHPCSFINGKLVTSQKNVKGAGAKAWNRFVEGTEALLSLSLSKILFIGELLPSEEDVSFEIKREERHNH